MKKVYLSLLFAGLISITMSFAQQIPFQGRLLETGIPVDGTRDFDFSIGDISWTESHTGVVVTEGLYSVVLGSITPLPSDLFKEVEFRNLSISVNGTPMSPIQVFAPPTSYFFENSDDSDMRPALHAVMSGNTTGWATIEGESYADTDATGIYGNGSSAVDGTSLGVYGRAQGPGKYNKGLYGIGLGTGNGDTGTGFGEGSINFGVEGNASGNAFNNTGVEGSNFGAVGVWNFGLHGISSAGTGPGVENHGVRGAAYGPGINYGVYGDAGGGAENWAGYFNGDVKIAGNANIDLGGSGFIDIKGAGGSPNIGMGGRFWEGNDDLAYFNLTGNVEVGGGYPPAYNMNITNDGTEQWVNATFDIQASDGSYNRPMARIDYDNLTGTGFIEFHDTQAGFPVRSRMGVDGGGLGYLELSGNGGEYFRIDANGINGSTANSSNSESGQTTDQITVNSNVGGDGTGRHYGMLINANSPSGRQNNGIRADAFGPGNLAPTGFSKNTGGEFFAQDNQDTNIGVQGVAWGTAGVQNYGGSFSSTTASAGTNYGIHSEASGGATNWAGWFEGDVMITGNLNSSGSHSYNKTIETGTGSDQGLLVEIDGDGKEINNAIRGNASTNSLNTGVGGYSTSGASNTSNQYGLYGEANGDGTGSHNGVFGVAGSTGKYNRGLRGYAEGAGNGDTGPGFGEGSINFGVEGNATGNAYNNTGVEGSNFGPDGVRNFGVHGISNAGTGPGVENHGVRGAAYGPGINYGIFGDAGGGAENWAGYFNGDVNITGSLIGGGLKSLDGEGDEEFNLLSTSATGIRMYGALDDIGGRRSHIALDGDGGEYVYLWGEGNVDASVGMSVGTSGEIYLDGASGNINTTGSIIVGADIGVTGNLSSNDINTNNVVTQEVNASNAVQAGDFFGGTGTLMSSGGDIDATGNINAGGDMGASNINLSGNLSSNNINTNDVITQQVNASTQVQAGDFFGGTGSILFSSGDVDATGNMSALSFNVTSDKRYKKNIQTLNNALNTTTKLRGVSYNWRVEEFSNKNFNEEKQVGLIAQEVEEVLPELVHTDANGMKSVNYSQMVAVLIEAVKELNSKIESLESENAELRASLDQSSTNSEQIKSLQKQINTLVTLMGSGQASDIQVTGEEK